MTASRRVFTACDYMVRDAFEAIDSMELHWPHVLKLSENTGKSATALVVPSFHATRQHLLDDC